MNRLTEGRGKTSLLINSLSLVVNDSEFGQVKNVESFFVDVSYYYAPAIEASEDEPPCEEYVDISEAICTSTLWFNNKHGVKVQIMWGTNILNLLSESQYTELVSQLIRQSKGSVAESVVDKYYDADSGKTINQRARQELGWGLK